MAKTKGAYQGKHNKGQDPMLDQFEHDAEQANRRASRYYRCRRKNRILKFLLLLMVVGYAVVGGVSYLYVKEAQHQAQEAKGAVNRDAERLAELEDLVEKMKVEMDALTRGRIPSLNKIVYDEVITIGEKYVKNLVFTLTRRGGQRTYEYKLVMHNTGSNVVQPRLRLILFDRVGLQLGISELKGQNDVVLIPDETRSHYAEVELTRQGEPVYYLLEVL